MISKPSLCSTAISREWTCGNWHWGRAQASKEQTDMFAWKIIQRLNQEGAQVPTTFQEILE
jgi:hypothetical protein